MNGNGVISSLQGWAARPFSEDMSVTQWALFVGLIICLCILWAIVIHKVTEVV